MVSPLIVFQRNIFQLNVYQPAIRLTGGSSRWLEDYNKVLEQMKRKTFITSLFRDFPHWKH